MCYVAHSTFSERFGYARWLRHLKTGDAPGFAEIGRAVDRTGPAVSAWTASDEPPPDWKVHEPLAQFFGVEERWLIRNGGEAPRPELWRVWLEARRGGVDRRPEYQRIAEQHGLRVAEGKSARDLAKKKEKGADATKRRRA